MPKQNITRITSYSGDVYEKIVGERSVTYTRVKKARNVEWTPPPRLLTPEEYTASLHDRIANLTRGLECAYNRLAWLAQNPVEAYQTDLIKNDLTTIKKLLIP